MKNGLVPLGPLEHPPLCPGPSPRLWHRQPFGRPLPSTMDLVQRFIFRQLMPSPPTTQVQPGLLSDTEPHALAEAELGVDNRTPAKQARATQIRRFKFPPWAIG